MRETEWPNEKEQVNNEQGTNSAVLLGVDCRGVGGCLVSQWIGEVHTITARQLALARMMEAKLSSPCHAKNTRDIMT